ncbi:hypothetical protein K9U39_00640 [Rhodoblastus acidophilus]|uniref:Uncharacterized protein n=1 Tax=Candidatus Rhodoblastus alkanivorans TaxID=2954117 RepID=A0ABS9Z3B3_9HYPH|nr:hypothetical protein [Candidatus Rhodoblastus alkanivorans]MCI4678775.1 hypothetical protein [Candidatus Rhodoblastus alkanivorans]MCI4682164.1 hypothetical protein [Candidatus Rhodoblastus alkanivorans]MDI4639466.1 hypothetical protein [Rhodoblastus acidophilus]
MGPAFLAVGGAVCLSVAIIEAWLIVAHFASSDGPVARLIPGGRDLVRSHIDYLMMALFLFVFYGLCRVMPFSPSLWIIAALCFGSFFNPFAFFVRAAKPGYLEAPPVWFKLMLTISCIATTVGYGVMAWTIAGASLAIAGQAS